MSVRQTIREWLIAIAAAAPLVTLYVIGDRLGGWIRWAAWGLLGFALLGLIIRVARAALAPLDEWDSLPGEPSSGVENSERA